eukprot:scaffold649_cov347-Pavlova_lutheri.AAC.115
MGGGRPPTALSTAPLARTKVSIASRSWIAIFIAIFGDPIEIMDRGGRGPAIRHASKAKERIRRSARDEGAPPIRLASDPQRSESRFERG